MKSSRIVLVLFLIVSMVAIAGCTDNNSYNNTGTVPISNESSNAQNVSNSTPNTVNPYYEASGYCYYVVDGDTIDVKGIGRIRFVGVNTPERGQPGYREAKDFVISLCLGKTVYLDIDDAKHYDKYGRTLAVIYAGNTNVNAELLKRGYAEIMFIPPSEFNPYSWVGNTNYQIKSSNINSESYYIGNKRSKKFHRSDCSSVAKMSESNKIRLNSRQESINKGYIACQICDP